MNGVLFLECKDDNINNYNDDITPNFCAEDVLYNYRTSKKIFKVV